MELEMPLGSNSLPWKEASHQETSALPGKGLVSSDSGSHQKPSSHFFFKDFIYSFMRDTEREAETQAEGKAGSMQGARRGTPSQDSRIMP